MYTTPAKRGRSALSQREAAPGPSRYDRPLIGMTGP